MKATSFQNGIEFKIHVEGEQWSQGDLIRGTCEAISRHPNTETPPVLVRLAYGIDKKVKAKNEDAFEVLEKATGPDWKFQLPLTAAVSEKSGSYYLLYGSSENLSSMGALRLTVLPHPLLVELTEVITTQFRFRLKSTSSGKNDFTEFKFDPPSSQDWALLDQLLLDLKIENDSISAQFNFKRNEVDPTKVGLSTKKTVRTLKASWSVPALTHSFNGRLNKDAAEAMITQVMTEYRSKGWL